MISLSAILLCYINSISFYHSTKDFYNKLKFVGRRQIIAVVTAEVILVVVTIWYCVSFWNSICDSSLSSCLGSSSGGSVSRFLLLSAARPFVFTPMAFLAVLSGKVFGTFAGTILGAIGALLSCAIVFLLAKFIGLSFVKPWLEENLPKTWEFLISQDYKIVFLIRLIPIFPFDIITAVFGLFCLRTSSVLAATFFGVLPEIYLISHLADPSKSIFRSSFVLIVTTLIVGLIFEFKVRKNASSLWNKLAAMFQELKYEIQSNNEIVKRDTFKKDKPPILVLYGFFSSRRTVTALEERIESEGFDVMTFNQGGLFNVFFTRSIIDTANFIDKKIKRQIERYGYKKIPIVAHSKGGLVALWWLLKLGGHKYCDTVITMGTPFKGTWLTYFPLLTPLGYLWRDIWEMRPGSDFLKELHKAEIPDDLKIYCMFSEKDVVTPAENGIFMSENYLGHVVPIPMHDMSHYDYLLKKKVAKTLSSILLHTK